MKNKEEFNSMKVKRKTYKKLSKLRKTEKGNVTFSDVIEFLMKKAGV